MGVVMSATHIQLDDRVAIKMMLPELAQSSEVVGRFLREGRAAVRIKSPHVARVYDVGELETGTPFIVMELLEGNDLSVAIETGGALPPEEAVNIVLQACEALVEAHSHGIVHRDLKPSNLFLARQRDGSSVVKVLDFGISKILSGPDESNLSMTATRGVLGSPLYMSPEQLKASRDVDVRSDIWSLGIILFELISGNPPFQAETLAEVGAVVLVGPTPRLRDSMPNVSDELSVVVRRCMARERDERYGSVGELMAALAPFASSDRAQAAHKASSLWPAAGGVPGASVPPPSHRGVDFEAIRVSRDRTTGEWASGLPTHKLLPKSRHLVAIAIAVTSLALVTIAWFEFGSFERSAAAPPSMATGGPDLTPIQPASAAPAVADDHAASSLAGATSAIVQAPVNAGPSSSAPSLASANRTGASATAMVVTPPASKPARFKKPTPTPTPAPSSSSTPPHKSDRFE